ncbi:MAG TPA: phosphoenolpyruvate--protein phosphotransferase [Acidobacteriota bacterium]|nr:phosphoenolpyruvate--protein phosphotransferase [Acidobacteriota bacterium]
MSEKQFQGIGISGGVAIGPAFILDSADPVVWMHRVPEEMIEDELQRFRTAKDATRNGLLSLKEEIGKKMGTEHAYIFDAHLLMLDDPILVEGVEKKVREDRVNVEFALQQIISELSRTFRSFEDIYMRERGVDVLDVSNRIQRNLCRPTGRTEEQPEEPGILVAHEVVPSKFASIDSKLLLGMAMDVGGQTTHTGLLARSLNLPAVVGLRDLSVQVKKGETIIVDGSEGLVIVDPKPETLQRYRNIKQLFEQQEAELLAIRDLSASTTDGIDIALTANIEMPEELHSAIQHGAMGIGLYRSEFVFLSNPKLLPTEDDHESTYRTIAEAAGKLFVNIRTLDLGGEKGLESLGMVEEPNPALGLRAVRYSLREPSLFKTQVRGILRASTAGKLRILIPMLTGLPELRRVKEIVEKCKRELREDAIPFDENIKLGAMIEVPSAALIADLLAAESDFVSVGTNDLIQYILAIDRSNASVAYLYDPFHPAVLRVLAEIPDKVHSQGKQVSMCGEMAADPFVTPLLVGFGYDELSMNAVSIPTVKKVIRSVDVAHCREIAAKTLNLSSAEEVRIFLAESIEKHYPSLFKCALPEGG